MARLKFPKRTSKTPAKSRFVGMEIECLLEKPIPSNSDCDYDDIWDDESGYDTSFLGRAKRHVLDAHDDGSIEGNGFPVEIVTQPLLDNRKQAIKALCNKIKERGGNVNKSCGGHIHVDAKDLRTKLDEDGVEITAIKFLTLFEPALYAITGKSRLNNAFCVPLYLHHIDTKGEMYDKNGHLFDERYWSINLSSLEEHGTLEFRLFAGTLEPDKWIARSAFAEAIVNKLALCIKDPKLLNKFHKKSSLSNYKLDDLVMDFPKSKVYKELIITEGPKLVDKMAKLAGLRTNYRNMLIQQHNDIWSKNAKG